jgi:hypothetical protein
MCQIDQVPVQDMKPLLRPGSSLAAISETDLESPCLPTASPEPIISEAAPLLAEEGRISHSPVMEMLASGGDSGDGPMLRAFGSFVLALAALAAMAGVAYR